MSIILLILQKTGVGNDQLKNRSIITVKPIDEIALTTMMTDNSKAFKLIYFINNDY